MFVRDGFFRDEEGRTMLPKGINLSGCSKVPASPDGLTHKLTGEVFYDGKNVSFVGRPFPLEEADAHFARLKHWGFDLVRFVVTWEAIEHEGPGIYDRDYLSYLRAVLIVAGKHGFRILIDPHQDCWSRFTGGDGAPAWTLSAVGIDITKLSITGAALIHNVSGDLPPMSWPTNYEKMGCATMFTLFFGSELFAPSCLIQGQSAQYYLQDHYIKALQQIAMVVGDLPHVIGFDTLNEPSRGYIGCENVRGHIREDFMYRECPSLIQGLLLASGYPQRVAVYSKGRFGFHRSGHSILNPDRHSLWLPGHECIWRREGVWGVDGTGTPRVLRPHHFSLTSTGERVDFGSTCLLPFFSRVAKGVRQVCGRMVMFASIIPMEIPPTWSSNDETKDVVLAPHFYDIVSLFTKRHTALYTVDVQLARHGHPWYRILALGKKQVRACLARQVGEMREWGERALPGCVQVMCETGVPFDLDNAKAMRTGNYAPVEACLDSTLSAMEHNLMPYILWNYTPTSTHAFGDGWNGEALSIFSRDDMKNDGSMDDGGRALRAVVRPSPMCIAGVPVLSRFDMEHGAYELAFEERDDIDAKETIIYVPLLHFGPLGPLVSLSDGMYDIDIPGQRLRYAHTKMGAKAVHRVQLISREGATKKARKATTNANMRWFLVLVALMISALMVLMGSAGST